MKTIPALPSELTIFTVGELRPAWLQWLATPADPPADREFALDAAAVDTVDAAGVQLLLSLARSLATQDRSLRLQCASATLSSACSVLGVSAFFNVKQLAGERP